ncbi:tRNA (guanosine(37)-N1)-methyltransferase TrmD [Sedimentisphaera salicampi]|uniref:tRNA (guanine-N(1)-)-methyltransferase n=1 Tax=Sedimentisphaera salicampi TaxID=1941349 RepID=A0A1W6LIT0_9BACT|nr:tRNA (guanosine(37)-N1)-methyltransferase TrmD [Sedimentisphaera salicampi]ARN55691.1 tRNA (guanine-N(1)-)-methyltransferase [Sedimentisphaera salicampi]OXU16209.1 tRNA (guanine-N(1)-)-methyltransferase [Sedimentisphaera salicampi]
MRFDILTLFPEMFASPMGSSILKRGQETGAFEIALSNIRDFTDNPHRKVDDKPYGGGPGMVMMCEPVFRCFEHVAEQGPKPGRVLLMTPQGRQYDQKMAEELSREERVVIIAGRYEGFDERIRDGLGAEQVSIGDYVLTGGELPAMVVVDSVARLLEGVLGDEDSAKDESFSNGLLEYPHYTRPENYRGMTVPEVLLSGHHKNIEEWRREKSLERTKAVRPDLFEKYKDNSKYQENNREN